jgi:RNA polymerase sigma-70 factor (ECF subfamily)
MEAVTAMNKNTGLADGKALSDEEIVERMRLGETALFEILMRRYNQRLFRVTRAILGNDSEAEDVMQEAYVRAYMHLNQFDGRAKFATWLTKIAIHEALARVRQRQRLVELDAEPAVDESAMNYRSNSRNPEEELMSRTLALVLETAIDALPPLYRSVFMLREVEGLNTVETAECLSLSEETVKVRLHRARSLLRKEIYTQTGAATAAAFQFLGARCDRMVAVVFEKIGLAHNDTP